MVNRKYDEEEIRDIAELVYHYLEMTPLSTNVLLTIFDEFDGEFSRDRVSYVVRLMLDWEELELDRDLRLTKHTGLPGKSACFSSKEAVEEVSTLVLSVYLVIGYFTGEINENGHRMVRVVKDRYTGIYDYDISYKDFKHLCKEAYEEWRKASYK